MEFRAQILNRKYPISNPSVSMSGFAFLIRRIDERRKTMSNLQSRMNNPVMILPDALKSLYAVTSVIKKGGVPERTLLLSQLRASQINGCGYCVDMHARELR